ncbi:hypothetical protein BHE74_00005287 [Ensete ventricosum]|nr:hypothetical protein BHE74_00005287 [Ensete ventricosum]RZR89482.1 hypothetical protein BHM03_00017213 [Ensete ventricosum]
MALSRLHLLLNKPPPHPCLPPSSFFSPLSSSFLVSSRRPRPTLRFSFARRLLCSKSDPPIQVRTSRVSPFRIPPPPSIPLISLPSIQSDPIRGEPAPSIVGDLLDYLNESWTQFHATAEAKRQLIEAGFHLLNENDEWDLRPGGRYFFTRNMSCLVAFVVGER